MSCRLWTVLLIRTIQGCCKPSSPWSDLTSHDPSPVQAAFTRLVTWEIWTPRFWQIHIPDDIFTRKTGSQTQAGGFVWDDYVILTSQLPGHAQPRQPVIRPGLSVCQLSGTRQYFPIIYFCSHTPLKHLAHLLMNVKDGIRPGMFNNCVHLLPAPCVARGGDRVTQVTQTQAPHHRQPDCWSQTHLNINVQNTKFRAECVTNTFCGLEPRALNRPALRYHQLVPPRVWKTRKANILSLCTSADLAT